jgi:hypothetical protein
MRILLLLLALATRVHADPPDKDLHSAKANKVTGIVLMVTGTAAAIAGVAVMVDADHRWGAGNGYINEKGVPQLWAGELLAIAGGVMAIVGPPIYVAGAVKGERLKRFALTPRGLVF